MLGKIELPSGVWRTQDSCSLMKSQEPQEALVFWNVPVNKTPHWPGYIWFSLGGLPSLFSLPCSVVVIRDGLPGFVQGYGFISDFRDWEEKGQWWILFLFFVKTARKKEASRPVCVEWTRVNFFLCLSFVRKHVAAEWTLLWLYACKESLCSVFFNIFL